MSDEPPVLPVARDDTSRDFARQLLIEAVRHYRATQTILSEVESARPTFDILTAAKSAFLAADSSLCDRLDCLIDRLAPRSRKELAESKSADEAVECGASLDGHFYILPANPGDGDQGIPMIVAVPTELIVNLD